MSEQQLPLNGGNEAASARTTGNADLIHLQEPTRTEVKPSVGTSLKSSPSRLIQNQWTKEHSERVIEQEQRELQRL